VIYITGATGFIGSRLARKLLERGEQVRCLVRSPQKADTLQALGAELMVGDIADEQAHLDGLRGAKLAFHLAAIYDIGIVDSRALQKTNVDGTRAFLTAVDKSKTPRAVYVSTTVALPPNSSGDAEPREAHGGPYPTEYHRTKAEAHRYARAAQKGGAPVVIVCPAFVYGPGDNGPGGRFANDVLAKRMPALLTDAGSLSFVHVDDVVDGLIAAGERGTLGEVYLLTGENASMNDYAQRIAKLGSVRAPVLRFPGVLAQMTGTILDVVARPTGLRLPITREGVASIRDSYLHAHTRATRDLGYSPRSLDQGLPETVAYAQAQLAKTHMA
jgi:nucleoside-diphosphate-sugar epimerase